MNVQSGVAAQILAQEFVAVSGPEQARAAVRENLANGADLIKLSIDSGAPRNWKTLPS